MLLQYLMISIELGRIAFFIPLTLAIFYDDKADFQVISDIAGLISCTLSACFAFNQSANYNMLRTILEAN